MKKFRIILTMLIGLFAFVACDDKPTQTSESTQTETISTTSYTSEEPSNSISTSTTSEYPGSTTSETSSTPSSSSTSEKPSSSSTSETQSVLPTESTSSSTSSESSTTTKDIDEPSGGSEATGDLEVINYFGGMESAYINFKPVTNASGYNVYIKKSTSPAYVQLDNLLIRKYSNYYRADMVGLEEGDYSFKVVAVSNNVESSISATTSDFKVTKHIREGFSWLSTSPQKTASGAYNENGTLKDNAQVLYITAENINTITLDVIVDSKGSKQTGTGLAAIMALRQKAYDKTPLNLRFVGLIKDSNVSGLNSSGYIQVKGCYNVTLEGIGSDTTLSGWSFLVRDAHNVEIRNFGLMLFKDDGISLDTDNDNIWVHNNDFFYGGVGSDSDQAKGDGSLDVKKSKYITLSFNHFWDSGKAMLLDASAGEGSDYITYHHNWFDHSDSRHPRVRNAKNVHVYNNYYDGVSKYGVGATCGSSTFVENNYFRSCKNPMLISKQGTDAQGDGTFSGEAGGMIKAVGNYMTGNYTFRSSKDYPTDFDAYVVDNKNDVIPSSVVTKVGGTTYNNFDTAQSMYKYEAQSAEASKTTVCQLAGRSGGSDFTWEFSLADDTDYGVNAALKSAIVAYQTKIVSIGGGSITGDTKVITAEDVIELINALPSNITLENESKIVLALNSYNLLSSDGKGEVTNYDTLVSAVSALNTLKADAVKALINAIGTVDSTSAAAIAAARTAYNKLNQAQKDLVSNYQILTTAEIEFQNFKIEVINDLIDSLPSEITMANESDILMILALINELDENELDNINFERFDVAYDKYQELLEIEETIDAIALIGEVTLKSKALIDNAKALYGALTGDQKTKVTNYSVLEDAIALYDELASMAISHNFTSEGKTSDFFTITGNLATNKGSLVVDGITLTQCLKLESSTSITFTTNKTMTIKIYFGTTDSADCKIDGTTKTADTSTRILTLELTAGSHTITKANTANVFYISLN